MIMCFTKHEELNKRNRNVLIFLPSEFSNYNNALRMRRLLGGGDYFTFAFSNAAFIGGRRQYGIDRQ